MKLYTYMRQKGINVEVATARWYRSRQACVKAVRGLLVGERFEYFTLVDAQIYEDGCYLGIEYFHDCIQEMHRTLDYVICELPLNEGNLVESPR